MSLLIKINHCKSDCQKYLAVSEILLTHTSIKPAHPLSNKRVQGSKFFYTKDIYKYHTQFGDSKSYLSFYHYQQFINLKKRQHEKDYLFVDVAANQ
jgi:hypothetical protein